VPKYKETGGNGEKLGKSGKLNKKGDQKDYYNLVLGGVVTPPTLG